MVTKLWLMAALGIVVGALTFGAAKVLIKPVYKCGFTAYVNNQQSQADKSIVTSSDLTAAQQLTKTYSQIIRSNTVLSESVRSIDPNLDPKAFKGTVFAEIMDGTELISVFVTNQDPKMAYRLAKAIAETAPDCMAGIVEGSSMRIVDSPEQATKPYGPSYLKYALLGFLLGFLIIAIKTIVEFFSDDRVKSEQQISDYFDIPILGLIPDSVAVAEGKAGNYYYYSHYGKRSEKQNEVKGYEDT